MELRHLRYFVAVADELHFGRAAQRLFIAQPPLSQQIRQLEEELEVELFVRTSRKVALTEAGQAFLKEARAILAQVDHAKLLAQRTAKGEVGELSLGFTNSAAFELLPRLLSAYRECYPHIHVTLQELKRDEQVNALHTGRIQVGILRPMVASVELCSEIIQREPLLLVLPSKHPLVYKEQVSIHDLAQETFVMLPRYWGSTFYDQIISLCYSAGFSPEVAQEAAEIHTIVGLVAANIGISLVPASTQFLRSRGVVYRRLQDDTSEVEMALAWHRDDRSPVVQAFLNLAREEMSTYVPDYEIT